jgi:hypothetical protein
MRHSLNMRHNLHLSNSTRHSRRLSSNTGRFASGLRCGFVKALYMRAFLCPWMDGMQQGARDGGAAMPWMDGMQQGARDGGAAMPWMDGM